MITACLMIAAWAANLPLWASITITVFAGVRFIAKSVRLLLKVIDTLSRD